MSLAYDSRFRPLERTGEGQEPASKTRDHALRNGIIVALIGALAAGGFGFWYTGPKAIGRVDEPYGYEQQDGLHAGEVPRAIIITGSILVRPDSDQPNVFITVHTKSSKIWPQGQVALLGAGPLKHFKCMVTLGSLNKKGRANKNDDGTYIVELVTADANAASAINDFVDYRLATSSTGMQNYPGPTDARTIATRTLHRSSEVKEKLNQPKTNQISLGCDRR